MPTPLTCDMLLLLTPCHLVSKNSQIFVQRKMLLYLTKSQKQTHVGTPPGFRWTQEAEDAVVDLGSRQEDFLLILVSLAFFFRIMCVLIAVQDDISGDRIDHHVLGSCFWPRIVYPFEGTVLCHFFLVFVLVIQYEPRNTCVFQVASYFPNDS
jgi:hypothetical protein